MKKLFNLTYRSANRDDLDWLYETEKACFNPCDAFSRKMIYQLLQNKNKTIIFDIIQTDQQSIGYAIYLTRRNSSKIRLYSLCILPKYSGQGFAKQYLTKRLGNLPNLYKEMVLEVRVSNKKALQLYFYLGFMIETTLPYYYEDGEDGYKMYKIIF